MISISSFIRISPFDSHHTTVYEKINDIFVEQKKETRPASRAAKLPTDLALCLGLIKAYHTAWHQSISISERKHTTFERKSVK